MCYSVFSLSQNFTGEAMRLTQADRNDPAVRADHIASREEKRVLQETGGDVRLGIQAYLQTYQQALLTLSGACPLI